MTTLTCIIVDDELHSRETTKMFLELVCPDVTLVAMADSGMSGIEEIKQHNPDFILLDIQMPQMSGIEMLSLIPDYKGEVIFVTAHDEYAVTAFKKGALHFLLKPVDPDELKSAIQRVAQIKTTSSKDTSQHSGKWLSVSDSDGWIVLRKADIIRCESFKNYTTLVTTNSTHTISKTLKEVEERLPKNLFYRVHNSHLVQIGYISKVIKSDGGNVRMTNGDLIPISKGKKKDFFNWFQNHVDQV